MKTLDDMEVDRPKERPKGNPSVVFQVLSTGRLRGELALLMMYLVKNHYPVSLHFGRSGYMACDRNSGILEWLNNTDAEYLIQCDEDMISPTDILRLATRGKDIVAASFLYIGDRGPTVAARGLDDAAGNPTAPFPPTDGEDPMIEVEWIGTGVYCISRNAAEKMIKEYGKVFDFDILEDGLIGQGCDVFMCRNARKIGLEVWLDRSLIVGHSKVQTWTPTQEGDLTYQKWGTLWRGVRVPRDPSDKVPINELFMLDPLDDSNCQLFLYDKELREVVMKEEEEAA